VEDAQLGAKARRLRVAFLFVALLFADAAHAEDLSVYFPTGIGNTWRYSVVKSSVISGQGEPRRSEKKGTLVDQVVERRKDGTAVLRRTVNESNSAMDELSMAALMEMRSEPTSVSVTAVGVEPDAPRPLAVPNQLLSDRIPGRVVQSNQGSLVLETQLVSQAKASTEVPAGKFSECLLTETKGPISGYLNGLPVQSGNVSVKIWYARDVGLVREERTLQIVVKTPDGQTATVEEAASKILESHTLQ